MVARVLKRACPSMRPRSFGTGGASGEHHNRKVRTDNVLSASTLRITGFYCRTEATLRQPGVLDFGRGHWKLESRKGKCDEACMMQMCTGR